MNLTRFVSIAATVLSLHTLGAATVSTQLTADETSVGGAVMMQVRVDGTTNVSMPPNLGVDGLDTRLTGRSTLVQLTNGRMSTSGVYTYTIIPLREGTFEIPAFDVNVDGTNQKTTPQKLVVQPGVAPSQRPSPSMPLPPGQARTTPRSSSPENNAKLAYAELIVPKKEIYAGEVVPVEIRYYFANDERLHTRFRPVQDEPQVSGEGFTVQKLSPAAQTEEVVNDTNYIVLAYKTSITAVKSGEMKLPTTEFQGILSVPSKGPPGMEDVFGQMFGGSAMPGFTDDREVKITNDPKSIRVKALPIDGRPADFSGAVGDFTISATADPTKAPSGDPVTLKVAVSGRGNFDAMGDPKLQDTEGWRVYPPTSHFEKSDAIGYGGTKTYETPMVAQKPKTRTPTAEFSYFDPEKAKYYTITSQPIPIEAAADQSPQTAAAATNSATPAAQPSATPAEDRAGAWLAHSTARSWQPVLKSPVFWILNGAAALLLAGIAAAMAVSRSRQGPAGQRAAVVQRRDRWIAELGRGNLADDAFYARALDALTLQAGLAGESGPFELVRSLESRGRNVSDLHTVLARADEIKFSRAGNATTQLDAEERRKIVRALLEVCR